MNKLVYGIGINDAGYVVKPVIGGKRVMCAFYQAWRNMLMRCYDEKCQKKHPTYADCTVCDEWLTFSNFKRWMEQQNWKSNEIDKDIIIKGNKIYSPEFCVFVSSMTNSFIIDSAATRGDHPIGASWHKRDMKFRGYCRNPFTKKLENLGHFDCATDAHLAWKKRKHELACQLADLQTDERVAKSLKVRYL